MLCMHVYVRIYMKHQDPRNRKMYATESTGTREFRRGSGELGGPPVRLFMGSFQGFSPLGMEGLGFWVLFALGV